MRDIEDELEDVAILFLVAEHENQRVQICPPLPDAVLPLGVRRVEQAELQCGTETGEKTIVYEKSESGSSLRSAAQGLSSF